MVMISRLSLLSTAAALFGVAVADLAVISPSSTSWWVAKSQNVLTWNCKESTHQTFTILVANKDQKVLTAPIAIVGIQNNFDCSKLITQDQSNQPAGTGYTILLANPLNATEIYATSEEFEIKPLGSTYPATTSVSAGTPTGSGSTPSGTSAGSGGTKPNGASSFTASFGLGFAAIGVVLGFVVA